MFITKETPELTPELIKSYLEKNNFSQDDLDTIAKGNDYQGIIADFNQSDYESFDNFICCHYPQIFVAINDI